MTGLSNRPVLMEDLERLIEESQKSETKLGLMFIDIDDFNSINASLGPRLGDMFIK